MFLTFGEIMLRLSPPRHELLMQTPRLDLWVAGAEANVATQLARLGHRVRFVSRVPDNDLGRGAVAALRGHGVDTEAIALGGDRMGLYFVTSGAGARAGDVIYDRAGSAFATATADAWDWPRLLNGVDRLHLTGITPALGSAPAAAALAAARAAGERGIAVSFDGSWRGKLWARGNDDPRPTLRELVEHADLLFGNRRDIALLFGCDERKFDDARAAADAAFAGFPRLATIASTTREVVSSDAHRLAAQVETGVVELTGIVDRIGGGDAFAAGVLHVLGNGDIDAAAHTGLAIAALKHSLPGDAALFRQADIDAFLAGAADIRR